MVTTPITMAETAAQRPLRTPFLVRLRPMMPRITPTKPVQHSRLSTKPVIDTGSVPDAVPVGPYGVGAPPYALPPYALPPYGEYDGCSPGSRSAGEPGGP